MRRTTLLLTIRNATTTATAPSQPPPAIAAAKPAPARRAGKASRRKLKSLIRISGARATVHSVAQPLASNFQPPPSIPHLRDPPLAQDGGVPRLVAQLQQNLLRVLAEHRGRPAAQRRRRHLERRAAPPYAAYPRLLHPLEEAPFLQVLVLQQQARAHHRAERHAKLLGPRQQAPPVVLHQIRP